MAESKYWQHEWGSWGKHVGKPIGNSKIDYIIPETVAQQQAICTHPGQGWSERNCVYCGKDMRDVAMEAAAHQQEASSNINHSTTPPTVTIPINKLPPGPLDVTVGDWMTAEIKDIKITYDPINLPKLHKDFEFTALWDPVDAQYKAMKVPDIDYGAFLNDALNPALSFGQPGEKLSPAFIIGDQDGPLLTQLAWISTALQVISVPQPVLWY